VGVLTFEAEARDEALYEPPLLVRHFEIRPGERAQEAQEQHPIVA
jgi:hypothetical protein